MLLHQVSLFFCPLKERSTQEFPHKQFWEKEAGASQNCSAIHSLSSGRDKPSYFSCDFYVTTSNYSIFSSHTHEIISQLCPLMSTNRQINISLLIPPKKFIIFTTGKKKFHQPTKITAVMQR